MRSMRWRQHPHDDYRLALHRARPAIYAGFGLLALLVLAVLLTRPSSTASQSHASPLPGISIGALAPDFALDDLQGRPVQLSRLQGRWVLLNFWGVTCPPCRSEMPALQQAFSESSQRHSNVELRPIVLGIDGDFDSAAAVHRYVSSLHIAYPVLIDATLSAMTRYHVGELPTSVLVDPSGRVSAVYIGPMSKAEIERGLTGQA